jgi:DNA-binding winged helix-turn-helix (wHTH) protein
MRGDFRIGERLIRSRLNAIEHQEATLHLEPKVMQVLLVLAEHAGDVVTRQKIRETVWPETFVGDDVLVRAISELRRAFQDDPHTHHTIETIPKVGYRLIAPVLHAAEEPAQEAAGNSSVAEPVASLDADETPQPEVSQQHPVSSRPSRRLLFAAVAVAMLVITISVLALHSLFERGARPVAAASPSNPIAQPAIVLPESSCPLISGAIYEVENQQTGSVLEVPFASATNGTLLDQWKSNGGNNLRWILAANGPYWTFTNVSSGKLLDVPGANRAPGVQVDQWQANHGANQNWILLPVGDKSCKIISQASGLLLDVSEGSSANGTSIIQYTDDDGANQHWIFRLIRKPDTTASPH